MCERENGNDNEYWDDDYFRENYLKEPLEVNNIPHGGGCLSVVLITVAICVGICLLALILGVAIPGAVISFFVYIVVIVALFSIGRR